MSKFSKPSDDVSKLDQVFGGGVDKLLPAYDSIPSEFKSYSNPWAKWQSDWFYSGLKGIPAPKEGIDARKAMAHLAAIQRSFAPKHEHKAAGVAYLASLWFQSPEPALATGA